MSQVCDRLEGHPQILTHTHGKKHLQSRVHIVLLLLIVGAVHVHLVHTAKHRIAADLPHLVVALVGAYEAAREVQRIVVIGVGEAQDLAVGILKLYAGKAEGAIPEGVEGLLLARGGEDIENTINAGGRIVIGIPSALVALSIVIFHGVALGIDDAHLGACLGLEGKMHLGGGVLDGIELNEALAGADGLQGLFFLGLHFRDGTGGHDVGIVQTEEIEALAVEIGLIEALADHGSGQGSTAPDLEGGNGGMAVGARHEGACVLTEAGPGIVGADGGLHAVHGELAVKPEGGMRAAVDRDEPALGDVQHLGGELVLALHQVGGEILGLVVGHVLGALARALGDEMTVEVEDVAGIAAGGGLQSRALGGIEFLLEIVKSGCRRSFVSADPMTHVVFPFYREMTWAQYRAPWNIIPVL